MESSSDGMSRCVFVLRTTASDTQNGIHVVPWQQLLPEEPKGSLPLGKPAGVKCMLNWSQLEATLSMLEDCVAYPAQFSERLTINTERIMLLLSISAYR